MSIYQVHWPDPNVPIEETAEAVGKLFEEGTIRAIGVSNFSPEQMQRFESVAPLHVAQSPYNLFERGIERDVLPYTTGRGLTVLAYGALCRGLRPAACAAIRSSRGTICGRAIRSSSRVATIAKAGRRRSMQKHDLP